ncbi:MAG: carotenoid 1,2-hydratase [Gammaproteobacteria bacterium]
MSVAAALPLPFDLSVAPDGYAWWYLDAIADDGVHGLTVIFFIGSVFSPFYARARRRGATPPEQHCAVNCIFYGPTRRWAFSEYDVHALSRDASHLAIGSSRMHWQGDRLEIVIDERCMPLPWPLRGALRVTPTPLVDCRVALDSGAHHHWQPLAPRANVEVDMDTPALHWAGSGYLDSNHGDRPLERDFQAWCWSRSVGDDDDTHVLYDVLPRDGQRRVHALTFPAAGGFASLTAPAPVALPATSVWRMARHTRSSSGVARVCATWEDTPFYARSLIEHELDGVTRRAVHESLSLDRFTRPWVQRLLPFRARRVGR